MSRMKVVMAVVVALMFFAGVVWSADQEQSKDRVVERLKTQDQVQDGSCQEDAAAYEVGTPVQSRDQLKDCTCDGEPDTTRDRVRDQPKDGSCQS